MFLTIEDGKLVGYSEFFHAGTETPVVLDTIEAVDAAVGAAAARDEVVMKSSSLDFPDEYTTDPLVLALVNWLNHLPYATDGLEA